jgi:PAS domain-containing protein
MGEFVCRAVAGVPGVASAAACLPGAERPRLGGEPAPECADCDVPEGDVDHDSSHPCRLSDRAGIQVFPLKTQDRHFGFLLLKLEERERYAPYEPFVSNLANGLAVNIERQWQKDRLEAATVELRRHREHLEELVRERTTEIQLGLKREHHLSAVLRAIRNVNQLIVREKDRERLLQQACEILAETRGFRCVWIVRLGADGRVEATAEAGIGPAFAGLRSQLERGELPECCRRALASEGPVVMANPVVNCAACPLPTEYRDTAGIAAPLRHEGRTYGVLIAALRAEMAADAEEISLFAEVASDLAFALNDIEMGRQRKRAEEALGQGAANLEAIFESSPVGMLILDETTNIVMANAAILTLCGGSKSDVLQHRPGNALRCVHSSKDPRGCGYAPQCPLCPARNGIETLLASGGAMRGAEVPLELNRNGEPRKIFVEIGAEPIMMNGRRHLCVAMVDITERKLPEEALRQKVEELRASNDELELFNRTMVGRELRMIELKEEINELCRRLGESPRHSQQETGAADSTEVNA